MHVIYPKDPLLRCLFTLIDILLSCKSLYLSHILFISNHMFNTVYIYVQLYTFLCHVHKSYVQYPLCYKYNMSSHMSQIYVLATVHVLSSNQSPIGHAQFMHHSFYCPKHFSVC